MADIYGQPPAEAPYAPPPPKTGMSPWLIVLIVVVAIIVLCCLCIIVGFLLAGPQMGNVFSQIIESVEAMTPVP